MRWRPSASGASLPPGITSTAARRFRCIGSFRKIGLRFSGSCPSGAPWLRLRAGPSVPQAWRTANSDPAPFRAVHAALCRSCRLLVSCAHGRAGGRVRAADGRAADLPHAGEDGANAAPGLDGSPAICCSATRQAQPPVSVRADALPTKLRGGLLRLAAAAAPGCGVSPRLANACRPGDACPAGGAVLRTGPAAIPRSSPARLRPQQQRLHRPSQRRLRA